jgi:hypothetical protein
MHNVTRFGLDENHSGLNATDAPAMFRLRQHFSRPVEANIEAAVRRELEPFMKAVTAGQRIAVTGSSRGIANFAEVVRVAVTMLKDAGAKPFLIPGMGSHGGATADGQREVLANTHGLDETTAGCPVEATMDVVQVGTTETGFPVYQDRLCHEADGVLVINRVKPHTGFTEVVESGLAKMLVIGLGKQAGASKIHQQALRVDMGKMILDASRIIVESDRPRLLGGLALVENAFKETARITAVPMDNHAAMIEAESALLREAYDLLARLPFEDLDVLIVDEIGKNISGSGMDTNVIGRKPGLTSPRIQCIYVRGLTEETHGNATGIGHADLMPRHVLDEIDLHSTYMNAYTAKKLLVGKIPMLVENELQAMQVFGGFRADEHPASLRALWIKSTSALGEMWASSALLDEAENSDTIEVLSAPGPVVFDADNKLVAPPL